MLLFPAVFLALGRTLLAAPVGGGAAAGTARRAACDVASNGLLGGVDPGCLSGLGAAVLATSIADLTWYAPAMLGLGLWAIGRVAARPRRIGRTGVALLLAMPLLEPVARPWLAPETVLPGPLIVLLPLLAARCSRSTRSAPADAPAARVSRWVSSASASRPAWCWAGWPRCPPRPRRRHRSSRRRAL
jgi:hypothetical protein